MKQQVRSAASRVSSGAVCPTMFKDTKGNRPTFYGYLRGSNPTDETILWWRSWLVTHCQANGLHLEQILHDWGVEKNVLQYPGLASAIHYLELPETSGILVADIDSTDGLSPELFFIVRVLAKSNPDRRITPLTIETATHCPYCGTEGRRFTGAVPPA